MGRLDGKVAVVIGVGKTENGAGNGSAVAIEFAREGAKVAVGSRNPDAVAQTIASIESEGFEAIGVVGDYGTDAVAGELIDAAYDKWGRIDVLHNNIGAIIARGTVLEFSDEDWQRDVTANVSSIMHAARHAIPYMKENGGGSIINISSIAAKSLRGLASYTLTKDAELKLTEVLASDHGPDGIRANAIMIGLVYGPLTSGMTEEYREARKNASALKVEGTPWDVAKAAVFLASDDSKWITGVTLPVDGGYLIAPRLP